MVALIGRVLARAKIGRGSTQLKIYTSSKGQLFVFIFLSMNPVFFLLLTLF